MGLLHRLTPQNPNNEQPEELTIDIRKPRIRPSVIVRVSVAVIFLGAAAYLFQERLFSTMSIDGVVTSPLIVLRSPTDGIVSESFALAGAQVSADTPLFTVRQTTTLDERGLVELSARLENLHKQLDQSSRKIREIAAFKEDLEERKLDYRRATLARHRAMTDEALAQIKGAQAAADRAKLEISRASTLASKGITAQTRLDDVLLARKSAESDVERFRATLIRLQAETDAADRGIIVGEGYADAPYSQQKIDDLGLKLIEVRAEQAALVAVIAETQSRLAAEKRRVNNQRAQQIKAPFPGVMWNVHVARGTSVAKNSALADLVDCENSFVEATVSERGYDAIRIGDRAQVKLYGNSTLIEGTVRAVRGSGTSANLSTGAARVAHTAEAMTVAVAIPNSAVREVTSGSCQVGRAAKVTFEAQPRWQDDILQAGHAVIRVAHNASAQWIFGLRQ